MEEAFQGQKELGDVQEAKTADSQKVTRNIFEKMKIRL